jgi:NADH-quinone oxidoreductase subunit G
MPIADVSQLKAALFIGSFLRQDQPLLTARVRQAARHGATISSLHSAYADWHLPLAHERVVSPSQLVAALAALVVAAHREAKVAQALPAAFNEIEPSEKASEKDLAIVRSLLKAPERAAIFLGSFAQQHEHATLLHALAQRLADYTGTTLGVLPEAANSVGLALAGAQPQANGLNTRTMLEKPRKAYVLLHTEAPFDVAQGGTALVAMRQADFVLSLSPFRPAEEGVLPDVVLPVAPFTETSGTFINMEGRVQSFHGVAPPLGETRPGWQVIVALAGLLDRPFDETTPEAVRTSCVPSAESVTARLSNRAEIALQTLPKTATTKTVERVAGVPMYHSDPLVRRAPSLQRTALAAAPKAAMNAALATRLNLVKGGRVQIRQGEAKNAVTAILFWVCDETLPTDTVRFDMAHPLTAGFDVCGEFHLEAAP